MAIYPVDVQKVYGDDDPDYYITEVVNGDWGNVTTYPAEEYDGVTVEREEGEAVGSYRLTVTLDAEKLDTEEYAYRAPEDITAYLTINPRTVYLQVMDAAMTEGDNFPDVAYSFYEADEETGEKQDALAEWMRDELAENIVVSYADAAQGPKLLAGEYDMSLDQIMSIDEASASSDAKVYMSFSGLYDNDNYDVNLLTLDEAHTKLATLTVNKKASDGGSGSSDSDKPSTPGSTTGQTTISSVKTGDSSNPLLYVVLLLAVIFGITVIWRKKVR